MTQLPLCLSMTWCPAAWFCSTCVGLLSLLSLFSCAFSHLHALHGLTFTRCLNCAIEVLPRGRLSTAGRDCRTHVVGYSLHLVSALGSQGILILLTTVCTRAWQSFLSTVSFLEDAGCSQSVRSGASACALGRFFWAVGSSNGYSHGSSARSCARVQDHSMLHTQTRRPITSCNVEETWNRIGHQKDVKVETFACSANMKAQRVTHFALNHKSPYLLRFIRIDPSLRCLVVKEFRQMQGLECMRIIGVPIPSIKVKHDALKPEQTRPHWIVQETVSWANPAIHFSVTTSIGLRGCMAKFCSKTHLGKTVAE